MKKASIFNVLQVRGNKYIVTQNKLTMSKLNTIEEIRKYIEDKIEFYTNSIEKATSDFNANRYIGCLSAYSDIRSVLPSNQEETKCDYEPHNHQVRMIGKCKKCNGTEVQEEVELPSDDKSVCNGGCCDNGQGFCMFCEKSL